MRLAIHALLACTALGLCLASPEETVRWCTTSTHETSKCSSFKKALPASGPLLSCVRKNSPIECIRAISEDEADAVTLDAGHVFEAGLAPYNLIPVVAEYYGSQENKQTNYYAVAVVKKTSNFQFNELQGKKSCHTGLGRSAGWNIPIGLLYWKLPQPQDSLLKAVSKFFEASCVPCADPKLYPKLCQQCAGTGADKCACSSHEPYFGYKGALKCLADDAGDVAFVKHLTALESPDKDNYELLCPDNTRKPLDQYKDCHLAQVPSHAVVTRSVGGKKNLIWNLLNYAQEHFGRGKSSEFQLFSSPHGTDMMFKDSTQGFLLVPDSMDTWMYLGYMYVMSARNAREDTRQDPPDECKKVKWCAVGHHERVKCDEWSVNSGGKIECESAESTEDCIAKISKGEADAMSLDGGYLYIAGKCGLTPVLAENYKTEGPECVNTPEKGYLAVAVVKASDPDTTWNNLKGKKSCHTGVDRTAGWNIPMGLLYNNINHCKFDEFFSQGCAPGYRQNSTLCDLCIGSENVPGKKCVPNNHERYYGYSGALRCLVEKGDVTFIKDETVLQNTGGNNNEPWAKNLKQTDFELLCLDGTRKPTTEAESCHLARGPNHAVVTRKDKAACVRQMLLDQQAEFGRDSDCSGKFCMFQSETKDLLFKDKTLCLAKLPDATTYETYLGSAYVKATANLQQCSTSKLLEACTFHKP
ncbi:serotransferrin-like [Suncus etruscus]|uniref:serotransferrin-like n=1 Tax=Suncus etruscus TaxID=109475 RepID=UPI0021107B47|nr:serotransferrin-like [Suncus etruscus]